MNRELMVLNIEQTQRNLAKLREEADALAERVVERSDTVLARIDRYMSETQDMQPIQKKDTVTISRNLDIVQRIWFASGQEVLGPEGRKHARDLIQQVQSAQKVTLRGYLNDDEFMIIDALDAERRSVGRSLSVRALWRASDVNTEVVSILHHIPQRQGRYVEVVIHE